MPGFPSRTRSLSSGPSARGTRVAGRKVLTLILAGGKGQRLGVLTQERAKPALTFGGTYRLIDFALSNCMHSGLSDVWVVEEYQLHSLNDHLTNGRPWDLDRTHGGLEVLPPSPESLSGELEDAGNADALYLNRHLIRAYEPDVVVVLSADHVYTLDYAEVIRHHLEVGADVTMVTVPLPAGEDARRFGNVTLTRSGRVKSFQYKPERPRGGQITTEVFVYSAQALLDTLDTLRDEAGPGLGLGDFGHGLIPAFVKARTAHAYTHQGYWLDVGLPGAYFRAHQDLLGGRSVQLDSREWPVLSSSIPRRPAQIVRGAQVADSLISYGCRVAGKVTRSVLSPGVVIEPGAVVEDAVILRDVTVRAGAQVRRAIVDEEAVIASRVDGGEDVAVIGARAHVGAPVLGELQVEPGRRWRAGSRPRGTREEGSG
ncbi:glucose-1-phosphate adenylyltransferase family protein [Deinococcus koreensis]|uniref:Glucose-1-phosphate adenylyltransferase n=1 Tax=Deinococcus koreensis TaxID=2054903 RepID=A0A2K3V0W6_9DEIO|nr:sugar phosphate nucleotidyltransferase [Deinococcus koreensis]PNY82428.1 glucose-1-phosphate adenylyltransferase [Deinococcus koreensis]